MAQDEEEISEITFKFIIVGNTNVGKSSLLLRYVKDEFNPAHYPTIGMEFFSKRVLFDNVMVKMQIWDTAGQQTFKSIVRNFYKNSDAVFLVYSIADKSSFMAIDEWFQQANTNSPEEAIYILIGSQKDLEGRRQVNQAQGQQLMKKYNMAFFFQTSAKMDENIDLAFEETAKLIIVKKLFDKENSQKIQDTIKLQNRQQTTKNSESQCC